MKNSKFIIYILVFLMGFLSSMILYSANNREVPKALGLEYDNPEAPGNWITRENIHLQDNKIIIDMPKASISEYASTGSMKPVLDKESNGIRIVPENENQISIGDIISFEKNSELIVHRVIKKAQDSKGIYFITKGDNNSADDGKVYFSEIKYVTIGVLY